MYYFQVICTSCRFGLFPLCIVFFLVFYIKLGIYVGKDFCNCQMCSPFSPGLHAEPQCPNQMFLYNNLDWPYLQKIQAKFISFGVCKIHSNAQPHITFVPGKTALSWYTCMPLDALCLSVDHSHPCFTMTILSSVKLQLLFLSLKWERSE